MKMMVKRFSIIKFFLAAFFSILACGAAKAQHPADAFQYYDSVTANSCTDGIDYAQAKIWNFCVGYANCDGGGYDCYQSVAYGWHDGEDFSYKLTVQINYPSFCYQGIYFVCQSKLDRQKSKIRAVKLRRNQIRTNVKPAVVVLVTRVPRPTQKTDL